MSTPYGTGVGQPPIGQPGKVNFGWISESFQYFSQAAAVWVVFALIMVAATGAIYGGGFLILHPMSSGYDGGSRFMPPGGGALFVPDVIILVIEAFFLACGMNMALKQVRGQQISFNDMFTGVSNFVPMLIYVLLVGVASFLGCCALCIGWFVVMGLLLPAAAMVGDGVQPVDAITRSVNAMKTDLVTAALLALVLYLIAGIGGAIVVGALVVYPMIMIVSVLAYRDMIGFGGGGFGGTPVGAPGAWPPPPTGGQPFGQPQPPQSGFGQPQPPQSGFGQPQPPQSGFGQPQPPQSGFSQPNPPQSGFSQPNPPQSGFSQPNPPQSGFSQPQPPQSGFGQPQPGQSQFGQPQPGQSPFGQTQPPAGQQPFGQNVFGNQNDVPPAAHPPQFGQPPADPTNPGTGGQ